MSLVTILLTSCAAIRTSRASRWSGARERYTTTLQTQSIADLGKLGDRLNTPGRELIWGKVRHGAGTNIAAYFVEPSGNVIELYTDLEQIYDSTSPPVVWGEDENWYNTGSNYRPVNFRAHGLMRARPMS
jgi:catechol 2,3-dioxygenase